jgi:hypothetical protein
LAYACRCLQDWPKLAPPAADAIVRFERQLAHEAQPAFEARYTHAWHGGDHKRATQLLADFTADVARQADALLDELSKEAAKKLGLPGVPPDHEILELLEAAAEAYAFEPTSDDGDASAGGAAAAASSSAAGSLLLGSRTSSSRGDASNA